MAKVTISRLGSGYRSSNALNNDFELIEDAFDNTLSRDGTGPNQMMAPLDMNSNRIINTAPPVEPGDVLRLGDVTVDVEAIAETVLPTKLNITGTNASPTLLDNINAVDKEGLTADSSFAENINAVPSNASVTSNFLENLNGSPDGGKVARVGDRLFVGGSVANDGSFPNVGRDWYTNFEVANGRPNGLLVSAQAGISTNDSPSSRVGLVVAARTSTVSADTGYAQGLHVAGVQDRTSSNIPIAGFYAEGVKTAGSLGPVEAGEFNVINKGTAVSITPYTQANNQSIGVQLASGGEFVANDATAALNVRNNGAKFYSALTIGHDAITGSDGTTGTGHAIQLARRHQISWYNSAGDNVSGVFGGVSSLSFKTRLAFIDGGFTVLGPTDNTLIQVDPVPSVANYFSIQAAQASGAPRIELKGSDTNANLLIKCLGVGAPVLESGLRNFANDAAAAAATPPVPINGLYRNGSVVQIRVT